MGPFDLELSSTADSRTTYSSQHSLQLNLIKMKNLILFGFFFFTIMVISSNGQLKSSDRVPIRAPPCSPPCPGHCSCHYPHCVGKLDQFGRRTACQRFAVE